MESGKPILLVSHDEDDHGWQFLDGSENPDTGDAVDVCLSHVVETDPTLLVLAELPPGWQAWRPSPQDKWCESHILKRVVRMSLKLSIDTDHNSTRRLRRKVLWSGHVYVRQQKYAERAIRLPDTGHPLTPASGPKLKFH